MLRPFVSSHWLLHSAREGGEVLVQKIPKAVNPKWYWICQHEMKNRNIHQSRQLKRKLWDYWDVLQSQAIPFICHFLYASACWGLEKVNLQHKLSCDKTHWRVLVIWKVAFCIGRVKSQEPRAKSKKHCRMTRCCQSNSITKLSLLYTYTLKVNNNYFGICKFLVRLNKTSDNDWLNYQTQRYCRK